MYPITYVSKSPPPITPDTQDVNENVDAAKQAFFGDKTIYQPNDALVGIGGGRQSYRVSDFVREKENNVGTIPPEIAREMQAQAHQTNQQPYYPSMENRLLITISSLFPWNLFPSSVSVSECRVVFVFRQLLSAQSHSVDIKDISNVFIDTSLFFATLLVVSRTFVENEIKVGYLRKSEAHRVRAIIEGLRLLCDNRHDTSQYEVDELIAKLERLKVPKM